MIKIVKITSKILKQKRTIRVFTPDMSKGPFSVLYMHDGQNLFTAETSFAGEIWDVANQIEHLMKAGVIPPTMVVGIDNNKYRLDEYAPFDNSHIFEKYETKFRKPYYGDQYTEFIVKELKPWIDKNYRTRADFIHTFIAGSSMGGLISLYAGLKYKTVFGVVGVFSPSTWWNETGTEAMLSILPANKEQGYYLTAGTNESGKWNKKENAKYIKTTKHIHKSLSKQVKHYHFDLIEGGMHNEPFWALQMSDFLRFTHQLNKQQEGM